MRNASSVAAFLLSASVLSACGSQPQPAATPAPKVSDEGVLAVVGKDTITVEDFNAKMAEQAPFIRSRYQSLEKKQEFLENLVRNELLAQEAERRGFDKDPDVRQAMKKMMVQKLMREAFDSSEQAITEEEIASFYQEHINDYVKPERVRLSHIFFNVPKADAQRGKVRAEAVKLAAEIKAKEAGPNKSAFADTAKERSDDQISKRAGGDLSFRTEQELTDLFGLEVAKAAFALPTGEISQVVETDRGLHVLKLTGRQAPMNRGLELEEVRKQIASRLTRDKGNQNFEAFVAGLREKAQVQVNEAALEAVVIDTAPAAGRGPVGGGLRIGGLPAGAPQVAPTQAEK